MVTKTYNVKIEAENDQQAQQIMQDLMDFKKHCTPNQLNKFANKIRETKGGIVATALKWI